MALRKPLVAADDGFPEEIPAGDDLDAPGFSGDVTSGTNANAGAIVIGAPVYWSAAGSYDKARANATGTKNVCGLQKDTTVAAGGTGTIVISGMITATTGQWDAITGQTGGLTAGAWYFLDAATAGKMTTTAPTGSGNFIKPIGLAKSTTEFQVDIQGHIKRA